MGLSDLDQSYLELLHHAISSADGNETFDFSKPYIKMSLRHVYPLFIFLHACVSLFGFFGNMTIFAVVVHGRLYKNPLFFFIANLALSDMIKSAIVLPITLANLLLQNWVFGSFLCISLPMMQSFPNHATMMTYLMIAIDRYRYIVYPMKSRIPAGLCTVAVWVLSVCIVLPYAAYIKYIDFGQVLGPDFEGAGICFVNLERNVEQYLRAIFVILFCLPLTTIAFLYVRVSAEFKSMTSVTNIHIDCSMQDNSETSLHNRATLSMSESDRVDPEGTSGESSAVMGQHYERHYSNDHHDEEIDLAMEKRTQKYMITMLVLFAICWCPINILILVTHFVFEDDDNTGHFDITYLTFTFFGFLSTCTNPVLFASWRMSENTKDRIRGYFRYSNHRQGGPPHSANQGNVKQDDMCTVEQTVLNPAGVGRHQNTYV